MSEHRWETVADRPALQGEVTALIERVWPRFITRAGSVPGMPSPDWLGIYRRWPDLQYAMLSVDGEVMAAGNAAVVHDPGPLDRLPDTGWDWAMAQSAADHDAERSGGTMVGLSVTIAPEHQGKGLAGRMVAQMKAVCQQNGLERLIIPVRPTWKPRYPLIPMNTYSQWKNDQGLPFDPWLRCHVRAGGRILHACDAAMTMGGTAASWESWLDMPMLTSGTYTGPGLLAPMTLDRDAGRGVYVEPNVWVVHEI